MRRGGIVLVALVLVTATARSARAQDIGHKLLGTIGLDAGAKPPPGLTLADRFIFYTADRLNDRHGDEVPDLGLELDARSNALAVAYTAHVSRFSTSVTFAAAAPLARISVSTTNPEVSLDKFGFTDLYVQPLGLSWRAGRVDAVASYGLYLPTARFRLMSSSASSGQVTHQFSFGGQLAFDEHRRWFLAGVVSYDLNGKKWGVDLTRGDTVQVQGGAGVRVRDVVEAGVAGYAQWQVRDDRGADLPERLRGARDRAFGVGPEISIAIRSIRARLRVRCAWDVSTSARPQGRLILIGLAFSVWQPDAARPTAR